MMTNCLLCVRFG